MSARPTEQQLEHLVIRTYRPEDQSQVARLYTEGLLSGQIAPNDTGADIENIHEAYFDDPANHFWVAEADSRIIGMIGVAREFEHTAEIRRLRVDPAWQHTSVAARLIETALEHCTHHGYLKVVLDTRCSTQSVAVQMFERLGFQHTRTKSIHGKDLLEFYLDLYRSPKQDEEQD